MDSENYPIDDYDFIMKKLKEFLISTSQSIFIGALKMASGDLNLKLNLDLMSISLERALYEPEVFPGLIYRMKVPKVVFLIFASGKIVCVGAKSEDNVKVAVANLLEEIQELDFVT